jgi:hypothetical protein
MSGITGMGTSFNLPNYHGQLFGLTPAQTPLLSMIGGLTGGGMVTSVEAEWQTYDLRDPGQQVRTRVEGAAAPTAEERVRANVRNVCQIHQEKVSVSYTKQAAVGMGTTPGSAPFREGDGQVNVIGNELSWQTVQALKSIALDVNWSFWNGLYSNPTTNSTARQTRGLLQAITVNRTDKSSVSYTGATSATDLITVTHALSVNDKVVFDNTDVATGIVAGRVYFVVLVNTTVSFKVSATLGGAPITLGTASNIALHKPQTAALAVADINTFVQGIFDNGGLSGTPILGVNSSQKLAITKAYATAYGQAHGLISPGGRVGGVAVDTVVTDFGDFGIMLDRHVPQDSICAFTADSLRPFFLNVPGKGVFFEEPLAKTGASDEVQLYGEIGLEYGSERAHGVLRGLAV